MTAEVVRPALPSIEDIASRVVRSAQRVVVYHSEKSAVTAQ